MSARQLSLALASVRTGRLSQAGGRLTTPTKHLNRSASCTPARHIEYWRHSERLWSCMPPLPPFDPGTLCPPPGRYPMTWDEVESHLVRAQDFLQSGTRSDLWDELQFHRAQVECLFGEVRRIWLAGSFVSGKLDPSDVDLTYLVAADTFGAVTEAGDLADLANLMDREWCVKHEMRVDAYLLPLPATVAFEDLGVTGAMAPGDTQVFQSLGLYDEIWQRCRGSRQQRRGYVEVTL